MKKEDAIHILTAMKKSYLALGIPDPEAVGALDIAIQAIQTDNSEKVYQKAFEDIRTEFEALEGTWDRPIDEGTIKICLEIISKHNPDKVENEGKE